MSETTQQSRLRPGQCGPRECFTLAGLAGALPNDEPVAIYTHLTDSDGQAAIEHRRPYRPRTIGLPS